MNVLIVDDEVDLRESISDLLDLEYDCNIDLCADGLEAFEACQNKEYDIIILDYRMPRATGLDFYRKLIETENSNKNTRILFLSGFIDEVEREIGPSKNVIFTNKPIKPTDLLSFVGDVYSETTH